MNKRITIYIRNLDGVYVIPAGITFQGFCVDTEPYEYMPPNSSAHNIWKTALRVFEYTNRKVPHPDKWDQETAWYRKAKVKTWRQFIRHCYVFSIDCIDGTYIFNKMVKSGGGFKGFAETKITVSINEPETVFTYIIDKYLQENSE